MLALPPRSCVVVPSTNRLLGCADDRVRAASRAELPKHPCASKNRCARVHLVHSLVFRSRAVRRLKHRIIIANVCRIDKTTKSTSPSVAGAPLNVLIGRHIRIEIVPLAKAHCNAPWCTNNARCCGGSLKTCVSRIWHVPGLVRNQGASAMFVPPVLTCIA